MAWRPPYQWPPCEALQTKVPRPEHLGALLFVLLPRHPASGAVINFLLYISAPYHFTVGAGCVHFGGEVVGKEEEMDTWKGWKTKAEAVALLGISERTIERMVQAGRIQQAYKRVPSRRPIAVLNPKDIDKVKAETIKPVSVPVPLEDTDGVSRALTPLSSQNNVSHLLTALASVTPQRVPLTSKIFLPLKEASEYSGLPMAYLRRLIGEGALPALKTGGYRIRRTDLENLYGERTKTAGRVAFYL